MKAPSVMLIFKSFQTVAECHPFQWHFLTQWAILLKKSAKLPSSRTWLKKQEYTSLNRNSWITYWNTWTVGNPELCFCLVTLKLIDYTDTVLKQALSNMKHAGRSELTSEDVTLAISVLDLKRNATSMMSRKVWTSRTRGKLRPFWWWFHKSCWPRGPDGGVANDLLMGKSSSWRQ